MLPGEDVLLLLPRCNRPGLCRAATPRAAAHMHIHHAEQLHAWIGVATGCAAHTHHSTLPVELCCMRPRCAAESWQPASKVISTGVRAGHQSVTFNSRCSVQMALQHAHRACRCPFASLPTGACAGPRVQAGWEWEHACSSASPGGRYDQSPAAGRPQTAASAAAPPPGPRPCGAACVLGATDKQLCAVTEFAQPA